MTAGSKKDKMGQQPKSDDLHRSDLSRKSKKLEEPREWFGLRELTEYASVSERTLRSWIHQQPDPLPAVQVGSKLLVRRSQFDAWLERRRVRVTNSVDVNAIVGELARNLG